MRSPVGARGAPEYAGRLRGGAPGRRPMVGRAAQRGVKGGREGRAGAGRRGRRERDGVWQRGGRGVRVAIAEEVLA